MRMRPYCPFDGDLDALILPEVNTEAMSIFLKELSRNHSDEEVVLILDKAGWHTAANLTIPENIVLHWLPPYSPELNPVEHLFDELREKWFRNKNFASLDAAADQLAEALKFLMEHPDQVKSMMLFDWMDNWWTSGNTRGGSACKSLYEYIDNPPLRDLFSLSHGKCAMNVVRFYIECNTCSFSTDTMTCPV